MLTRGFVGENALVYAVAVASEGRLAAFRPVADVLGLDLVFMALDGADVLALQVKAPFLDQVGQDVLAQVDEATFRARSDRLLVVAPYLPLRLQSAPVVWLMRMDEFARLCPVRAGKRNFFASARAGGGSKFAPHRYGLGEVGPLLETLVSWRARAGSRAPLATRRDEVARLRKAMALADRLGAWRGGQVLPGGGANPPAR